MSPRFWIVCAGLAGATGVVAGAFGAHGLEKRVAGDLLDVWKTGANYQLLHSPVLLGVGILIQTLGGKRWLILAGWFILAGIIVFSGSLYLLVLTGQRWWGAITPIGGTSLILGWISLMLVDTSGERRNREGTRGKSSVPS